jgi:hypothetical protein
MKNETSVRQRGQLVPMIAVSLLVLLTLAAAGANVMPGHFPTVDEVRASEQRAIIAQRRVRISLLAAQGDRCTPAVAHELARALVYDGRSARAYAEDYESRCGTDPEIERWRNAPVVQPKSWR